MYKFDFSGLRVFLTGGARGMGQGMAEAFAGWGATVGVTDIDEAGAQSTSETIVAAGGRAMNHGIDVADDDSVDAALHAFLDFAGGIDLAINAAAVFSVCEVLEMESAEWRRVLDVNATGSFIVARAAARAMIERETRGSIVCVSSCAGKRGAAEFAHYSASKFAVIGLVQGLACELAKYGIRVNAVCPGTVRTPMIDELARAWNCSVDDMLEVQVIKRTQTPVEIATGIASLHINEAVTGQSINVDGGTEFH